MTFQMLGPVSLTIYFRKNLKDTGSLIIKYDDHKRVLT